MQQHEAEAVVNEIFGLYVNYGNEDYIGEPVSQLEHMCQAAQLAEAEGCSDEIILAAFFHDIGHLCEHIMPVKQMDEYGIADHESIGGDYLRSKGFSEDIAMVVESHVRAKRYLTYRYPEYYLKLSSASRETLQMQGGIMTASEALDFEADPLHPLYIRMRRWDDQAKQTAQQLPALEKYRQMAINHLVSGN